MKSLPFVSVVILNFNGYNFVENCLRSILLTDYKFFEIIFIDNNSSDDSLGIAESFAADSRLKIISLKQNLGFSKGNNVGSSYASGKYVVFLNNDTVVDKNWLTEMVNVLESNNHIGAVQPLLYFLKDPEKIQSAGNFIDTMGFTIPRIRLFKKRSELASETEISATGAAFMINKDLFDSIGRFETNFFVYYEDTDLSWRIRMASKNILLVPSSIVYHAEGAGLSKERLAYRLKNYVANQLFTIIKNYSLMNGFPRLAILSILYIGGFMWLAVRQSPDLAFSFMSAFFQFISNFPKCWQSHLNSQAVRKVDDKQLIETFLKPFNINGLIKFYSSGMGYVHVDYSGNSIGHFGKQTKK